MDKHLCPACGSEFPPHAAEGLCPKCLLRRTLEDDEVVRVGPYTILRLLGEGGMGIVYLAKQEAPLERTVALKVLKPGMDSRAVIARFESERRALALMDHPNIAQVYDAGSDDMGHPYFVMEYVEGVLITAYCDAHQLTTRERLELLKQVCMAIHHAHQKGVIHCDIKPSNVLVTTQDGKPLPKVIDFGVARAMNQPLSAHTLFTEQGPVGGHAGVHES